MHDNISSTRLDRVVLKLNRLKKKNQLPSPSSNKSIDSAKNEHPRDLTPPLREQFLLDVTKIVKDEPNNHEEIPRKRSSKTHSNDIKAEQQFNCEISSSSNESAESNEQEQLKLNVSKRQVCVLGKKLFAQKSSLKNRQKINDTNIAIKSEKPMYFEETFSKSSDLTRNLRTHKSERTFVCKYCEKTFTTSSNLDNHLRIHTGEKPYKCSYCNKDFYQSSNLTSHLRIHTGEKPFKCKYCEGVFPKSNSLKIHLRTHTGEKPYKCNHCGKLFSDSSNKNIHLRTHTGEKPFKCKYCEKAFSTSSHLVVHLRIHTGEKPFECNYCGKLFTTSGNLCK